MVLHTQGCHHHRRNSLLFTPYCRRGEWRISTKPTKENTCMTKSRKKRLRDTRPPKQAMQDNECREASESINHHVTAQEHKAPKTTNNTKDKIPSIVTSESRIGNEPTMVRRSRERSKTEDNQNEQRERTSQPDETSKIYKLKQTSANRL